MSIYSCGGRMRRFSQQKVMCFMSSYKVAHHPLQLSDLCCASGYHKMLHLKGIQDLRHGFQCQYRFQTSLTLYEKFRNYLGNLSPREEMKLEEEVLNAISHKENGVIDPVLNTNIRPLGWVTEIKVSRKLIESQIPSDDPRHGNTIVIKLLLPTLMLPHIKRLKDDLFKVTKEAIWKKFHGTLSKEEGSVIPLSDQGKDFIMKNMPIRIDIHSSKPMPFVRSSKEYDEVIQRLGPGLANVRHFIAVYSCKGGVGKSTTAVNLAYELSRLGGRVGLLDVDVYGPSLPVLVKPDDPAVRTSTIGPGVVQPITHKGIKMLSLGFVSPQSGVPGSGSNSGAAVMRGPMAGRVVTQLLKGTEWGELDVLVLDLPPGTGDVQLQLCQDLELSGAVSVTTPSKLAFVDAAKGIEMFTSLGVPTLAVVENMSFFDCEGGARHFPFGQSIKSSLHKLLQSDSSAEENNIFQFPISTHLNDANDAGIPLCLSRPKEAVKELEIFNGLAISVANELLRLEHGQSSRISPSVMIKIDNKIFDVATLHLSSDVETESFVFRFFSDSGATEVRVSGDKLRNWHPKLGEPVIVENDDETVLVESSKSSCGVSHHHAGNLQRKSKLFPCKIEKKGRYGYQIEWADGATIIYSMYSLAKASGGSSVT